MTERDLSPAKRRMMQRRAQLQQSSQRDRHDQPSRDESTQNQPRREQKPQRPEPRAEREKANPFKAEFIDKLNLDVTASELLALHAKLEYLDPDQLDQIDDHIYRIVFPKIDEITDQDEYHRLDTDFSNFVRVVRREKKLQKQELELKRQRAVVSQPQRREVEPLKPVTLLAAKPKTPDASSQPVLRKSHDVSTSSSKTEPLPPVEVDVRSFDQLVADAEEYFKLRPKKGLAAGVEILKRLGRSLPGFSERNKKQLVAEYKKAIEEDRNNVDAPYFDFLKKGKVSGGLVITAESLRNEYQIHKYFQDNDKSLVVKHAFNAHLRLMEKLGFVKNIPEGVTGAFDTIHDKTDYAMLLFQELNTHPELKQLAIDHYTRALKDDNVRMVLGRIGVNILPKRAEGPVVLRPEPDLRPEQLRQYSVDQYLKQFEITDQEYDEYFDRNTGIAQPAEVLRDLEDVEQKTSQKGYHLSPGDITVILDAIAVLESKSVPIKDKNAIIELLDVL